MARDIGIDLGTANTLIYMKGKGIILREPSVVAVDIRNDTVKFVGTEAKEVEGRTPASIVAVRPLKDGVIADFDIAASMLQLFIHKTLGNLTFNKPRIVICIPSGVTAVERRAVREVAFKAGAKQVAIVEEPMAAAIGAGLKVAEPTGSMIVDIGGGTAEVAVVSMGSIVASKSVRCAGDDYEHEIISYVKRQYNVLIGDRTAEEVKCTIGSAAPYEGEKPYVVMGRNLVDGFPKEVILTPEEIRKVLAGPINLLVDAIFSTLDHTPPELSSDIYQNGITLAGGGVLLHGITDLIQNAVGIPARVAENPLDCVAKGTGIILESPEIYNRSLFYDGTHITA